MIVEDAERAREADTGAPPAVHRIVLATDLTAISTHAHAFAAALASALDAELCLLHVVPDPQLDITAARRGGVGLGEILERYVGDAEQHLRRIQRDLAPTRVTTIVRIGTAEDEIARCAQLLGADLVVVGGRNGGARTRPTDVGERLRERARCPVITVPPAVPDAAGESSDGRSSETRVRCILAASDLGVHSGAALRIAEALAGKLGCRLHVVHVTRANARPAIPAHWLTRAGNPAAEILACARALGADLIVLGTHGRGPLRRALLGSVARTVVEQAPCPAMTVRCVRGRRDRFHPTRRRNAPPIPDQRSIVSVQPARHTAIARQA